MANAPEELFRGVWCLRGVISTPLLQQIPHGIPFGSQLIQSQINLLSGKGVVAFQSR